MSRFVWSFGLFLALCCGCREGAKEKAAPPSGTAAGSAVVADAPPAVTPPATAASDVAMADAASPGSAAAAPATDEDAAKLIYAAFQDSAQDAAVAALLPKGRNVAVTARGGGSGKKTIEGVAGLRELAGGNATAMKVSGCAKSCCELKPEFDDDRKLGAQLRKVCFDDKRVLVSVEIVYEN